MKKTVGCLIFVVLTLITVFYCSPDEEDNTSKPDAEGNLEIINETGVTIELRSGQDTVLRKIPESYNSIDNSFLVNVETAGDSASDLRVFKEGEDLPHRRWQVVLSADTEPENRANWRIGEEEDTYTGTFVFNYEEGMQYTYVTIFRNSTSGTRLGTINAGNKLSLGYDYGRYHLVYDYRYSNPNDDVGSINLGTMEQPYIIVINDNNKTENITVPENTNYTHLKIINSSSERIISVWANENYIENVSIIYGTAQFSSDIHREKDCDYFLETSKNYDFKILSIDKNDAKLQTLSFTFERGYDYVWEIDDSFTTEPYKK